MQAPDEAPSASSADEAKATHRTVRAIAETARRAQGIQVDLPHPYETDQKLGQHLEAATVVAGGDSPTTRVGRARRRLLRLLFPAQVRFNHELIDIIHQLDHRDRQLREDLADAHQRLAALTATAPQSAATESR